LGEALKVRPTRHRTTLVALCAAIALATLCAGCKPSSLAPFTDLKGPDPPGAGNISGTWRGTTGIEGTVSFVVAGREVADFLLSTGGECGRTFTAEDLYPLVERTLSIKLRFETGGEALLEGVFTSDTTFSGTYSFARLATPIGSTCPTSGSGTFAANRVD
jgi:hypothetical protein